MGIEQFKTSGSEIKHSNHRWIIQSTRVLTPDGDQEWEQLKSVAPAVVIVPVNNEGKIGIISQNRVQADGQCRVVYEFPSGWMEVDRLNVTKEEIEENANRELQEEIGLRAEKITHLVTFQLGNFAIVPFHVVLATDLVESKLKADDGELIGIKWTTVEGADQKLLISQVPTAQVYIALQEYKNYLNKKLNSSLLIKHF